MYVSEILYGGCKLHRPVYSVMVEITDATNITKVSSLKHYSEPYVHPCIIIRHRLCATSKGPLELQ